MSVEGHKHAGSVPSCSICAKVNEIKRGTGADTALEPMPGGPPPGAPISGGLVVSRRSNLFATMRELSDRDRVHLALRIVDGLGSQAVLDINKDLISAAHSVLISALETDE